MKYLFMKEHSIEFPVDKMAKVLRVYRSGYYKFLSRGTSQREIENQKLSEKIKEVHRESREIYGSPRIHQKLKKQGEKCSRKRVARLMQKEKIQAKMRKKWVVTTQPSRTQERVAPNHLDQKFTVEEPNKVWVSDITYVATQEGWLYVAVILDLFSRKIVGLSMGDNLHTDLIIKALKQALWHRNIKGELMHHSDRGCQYTSADFQELTTRHGIKLSMSAKGHCYDNAVAESFFHTLKTEHTDLCKYKIREEAKASIFEYIEVFYNRQRMHSTLDYASPEEFEQLWWNQRRCI
jgi:transposase InsO family protein